MFRRIAVLLILLRHHEQTELQHTKQRPGFECHDYENRTLQPQDNIPNAMRKFAVVEGHSRPTANTENAESRGCTKQPAPCRQRTRASAATHGQTLIINDDNNDFDGGLQFKCA